MCLVRKLFTKHGKAALGGFTCCFVLNDIPMLDENSILQANDVRRDPVRWQSDVGESAMNDDIVATCKNPARLIAKRRGRGLGEIEEAVTTGRNMGAVLDVVGRPVPLGRGIVAPVEQCVECFEDAFLVFRFALDSLFSPRSIFGVDPSGARRHCCNGKRAAILKSLKEQGI